VIKIDRTEAEVLLETLTKLKLDMEVSAAKRKVKLFTSLTEDTTLLGMLNRQNKKFLDDLRRILMLEGVSTLKKAELSKVLENELKEHLKEIFMELDMLSYNIMKKAALNAGLIKENEVLSLKLMELYEIGLIFPASKEEFDMCFVIPSDTLEDIKNLINDFEIISAIKLSDKICSISRGILFYYGALDTDTLINMVVNFLNLKIDSTNLAQIIYRNIARANELGNDFCFSPEVLDPEKIIEEQTKRSSIAYLPLTLKDVLVAGKEGYQTPWNQFDKKLYSFILDNFDITAEETTEEIDCLIDDFKNGVDFNTTLKTLRAGYDFRDLSQLQEMMDLLVLQYNNCSQYILKGHSPSAVKPKAKDKS